MTECRIVVLIPTFNDHDEINQMVIDILKLDLNYEILVVDDGSDRPVNVDSASERVRLIRLPDNLGIGLCVGVAIDYALNIGADFLVRVDGDGQHPVESIPELVAHCRLESADLVLGCRVGSSIDSTDKLARAVMKNWMNFWLRLLFRLKIKDPHTGFCALSHRALTHLKDRDGRNQCPLGAAIHWILFVPSGRWIWSSFPRGTS